MTAFIFVTKVPDAQMVHQTILWVPLNPWQVFPTLHTIVIICLHLSTPGLLLSEKSVSYATVYPQCLVVYHFIDSCHL